MHEKADIGDGAGHDDQPKGYQTRLIIFGIAAIAAIVFVAQNRERVTIHFLFFEITARVWIGFVICLALGALLGALVGRWWRRRQLQ